MARDAVLERLPATAQGVVQTAQSFRDKARELYGGLSAQNAATIERAFDGASDAARALGGGGGDDDPARYWGSVERSARGYRETSEQFIERCIRWALRDPFVQTPAPLASPEPARVVPVQPVEHPDAARFPLRR